MKSVAMTMLCCKAFKLTCPTGTFNKSAARFSKCSSFLPSWLSVKQSWLHSFSNDIIMLNHIKSSPGLNPNRIQINFIHNFLFLHICILFLLLRFGLRKHNRNCKIIRISFIELLTFIRVNGVFLPDLKVIDILITVSGSFQVQVLKRR